MNHMAHHLRIAGALVLLLAGWALPAGGAETLKVHGIFRSNMVLQRDKPINCNLNMSGRYTDAHQDLVFQC